MCTSSPLGDLLPNSLSYLLKGGRAFIDEGEGGPLWSDSKDDQEDEELCLLDKKEINGVLRASAFYRI